MNGYPPSGPPGAPPAGPPRRLPVLTEVVQVDSSDAMPVQWPEPEYDEPAWDMNAELADLQRTPPLRPEPEHEPEPTYRMAPRMRQAVSAEAAPAEATPALPQASVYVSQAPAWPPASQPAQRSALAPPRHVVLPVLTQPVASSEFADAPAPAVFAPIASPVFAPVAAPVVAQAAVLTQAPAAVLAPAMPEAPLLAEGGAPAAPAYASVPMATPLASPGFSNSWWTEEDEAAFPPVSIRAAAPLVAPAVATVVPMATASTSAWSSSYTGSVAGVAAPEAAPPLPTADQLAQRVLADLDRQLSLVFEQQMLEVVVPALARASETLVSGLRADLVQTLREMVERAVAMELARHANTRK